MTEQFEKNLKKALNSDQNRIDQSTRDELARRRRQALDDATNSGGRRWLWLPAGVAAAAVIAVIMARPITGPQIPIAEIVESETDMEILLADDFELIEDLEFYEWLELASDAG